MLEVRIERVPGGVNEKKVLNPTMKMLEFVLFNAGFSEGVWILKSPHRTRKKSAERFMAMRIVGTGFRIRCKPGGNDTCYEWTLYPPEDVDQDSAFSDLCSLHPKTMRSTRKINSVDEAAITGLIRRMVDLKPELLPQREQEEKEEFEREISYASDEERAPQLEVLPPREIASEVGPSMESVESMARIDSLDLSSMKQSLSSDYAMDRALIAFEMLAGDSSFLRRSALSEGFNNLLRLSELSKNSPIYGSVKGAMRAILMACCSSEYMERLMYGENSTNGYRLTEKGKERLLAIRHLVDLPVAEVQKTETQTQKAKAPAQKDGGNKIGMLRELIAEHDSVSKGIDELRQLIEELEGENEDEELRLSGLNKAIGEKTAQRDDLDREISRLQEKSEFLQETARKRSSDMYELRREMNELSQKKTEIESKLDSR